MSAMNAATILLKIYGPSGELLVSRPCRTQEDVDSHYRDYVKKHEGEGPFKKLTTGLPPRI